MGVPSGSYFFVHVNRIVVVVELKFCIGMQEECIRVQEEFVLALMVHGSVYIRFRRK